MELKLEYMQGEDREGYYVQPLIKRIWAVQLDMLKRIDMICRCHQIKYCGWFGTLLGAVRHRGFIPWDDDLDLAMLRTDYEQFRHYIKSELPTGWEVSEHKPAQISIFNTNTIRLDPTFLDKFHGCPFKTGIDIFCLDHIPQDEAETQLQANLCWAVQILCVNWQVPENNAQWKNKSKWKYLREIGDLTGYCFDSQRPVKEQLYFLGDRIAAMYWEEKSNDVTNLPWLYEHPHYRIPRSCFDTIIEVPYEYMTIPIPKDYDLICRLTYGKDYMTPLKISGHDYLKGQIDSLRNYFQKNGEPLPEDFNMTFD